jgi:dipeptidyl aminopeptidase/acylaminoacyl peptidase
MFVLPLGALLTLMPLLAWQTSDADSDLVDADALRPTMAEIFRAPDLLGLRPSSASISADGAWAVFRWTPEHTDDPERDWWLVSTSTGEAELLYSADEGVSLQWTTTGALLIVQQDGWIDTLDVAGDRSRRPLFEAPAGASLRFLDDGRLLISSRSDRSLWLIELDSGKRRRLTDGWRRSSSWYDLEQDAGLVAFFAEADEPAEPTDDSAASDGDHTTKEDGPRLVIVHLDGGSSTTLALEPGPTPDLSPDGRWVCSSEVDRSSEHDLIMADYLTEQVTAVRVRGSLAGDPTSKVSLSIHDIEAGEDFVPPLDDAGRYSLRRTAWSPDGSLLLVDRISGDSHVRQVLIVDPQSRQSWPIFSERDDAWIGAPTVWSGWSQDGQSVLLTSERSGFNHLYRVDARSGHAVALTSGDWEVDSVLTLKDDDRLLLSSHAGGDPASMQLHLVNASSGAESRLTSADGWANRPQVSADGGTILYRWATLGRPWDLYSLTVGDDLMPDAAPVRLSDSVPAALAELDLPVPELVTYENPDDGVTVHAYLYKPVPFDPSRRYPAVMFIHGAGQLQQVRRSMSSYTVNMLFHHRLTRQGFVVIDPDFRHSEGYGRDFRGGIYGFMGGKDLDDCVAGIDYLETLEYVDTDRVGTYGGSYGGFLVLMALFTKPDAFAAGAALRSVTDWRTYNHWYTNPRLGLPDEDPEAYERSSPIDHAEGLEKPLLLLHGLKDNNVFAQDTIRLMEKLIELGKDFDAMLYPSQGHGFTDPASWIDEYKRIERLFLRELSD